METRDLGHVWKEDRCRRGHCWAGATWVIRVTAHRPRMTPLCGPMKYLHHWATWGRARCLKSRLNPRPKRKWLNGESHNGSRRLRRGRPPLRVVATESAAKGRPAGPGRGKKDPVSRGTDYNKSQHRETKLLV